MKDIKLEERLIVAIDLNPESEKYKGKPCNTIFDDLSDIFESLSGTGVILKLNSLLRSFGYEYIRARCFEDGLKLFADYKLNDIPNTMKLDASLMKLDDAPSLLTVMCSSGVDGMKVVQETLPDTEVLGVTVLTSFDDEQCKRTYGSDVENKIADFVYDARQANIKGVVCSPHEVSIVKDAAGDSLTINTPGIRPKWAIVDGDDQKRFTTPRQAIEMGADRIVIGRPITQADNMVEAIEKTLKEIEEALKG